jgi:hypothetical protein
MTATGPRAKLPVATLFVVALLATGVAMWKFGGKGYTVSEHPTVRSVGLVPPTPRSASDRAK